MLHLIFPSSFKKFVVKSERKVPVFNLFCLRVNIYKGIKNLNNNFKKNYLAKLIKNALF